jgi:hypothetical protein
MDMAALPYKRILCRPALREPAPGMASLSTTATKARAVVLSAL